MSRRQKIVAVVLFSAFLGLVAGFILFKSGLLKLGKSDESSEPFIEEPIQITDLNEDDIKEFIKTNLSSNPDMFISSIIEEDPDRVVTIPGDGKLPTWQDVERAQEYIDAISNILSKGEFSIEDFEKSQQ